MKNPPHLTGQTELSVEKIIILAFSAALIAGDLPKYFAADFITARSHHKSYIEPGSQFSDLKPFLKEASTAGYLSDRPFNAENLSVKHFLMAQYQLAPLVLDYGNALHSLVIIDCDSLLKGIALAERSQLSVIYVNPHGIILAQQ